jgi:hypothetical protein
VFAPVARGPAFPHGLVQVGRFDAREDPPALHLRAFLNVDDRQSAAAAGATGTITVGSTMPVAYTASIAGPRIDCAVSTRTGHCHQAMPAAAAANAVRAMAMPVFPAKQIRSPAVRAPQFGTVAMARCQAQITDARCRRVRRARR